MDIIKIKNLCFKYSDNIVFKNFSINIKSNIITTILGKSCSGKTTLARIIAGELNYDGEILYNSETISNVSNFVSYVHDNPKINLKKETVLDNLLHAYNNSINERNDFKVNLNNVLDIIDIDPILNQRIDTLSGGEAELASLGCALITNPQVLILDEALVLLENNIKESILKKLKSSKLTIINITSDIEQALFSKEIVIINNSKLIIHDKYDKVLENEKLLKNNGINCPFIVEVSNKLTYYNLINKIYYSISKLVNAIWK